MVFPVLQMLILLFDLCFDSALPLWSLSWIYPVKQIFLSVDLQVELRMLSRLKPETRHGQTGLSKGFIFKRYHQDGAADDGQSPGGPG